MKPAKTLCPVILAGGIDLARDGFIITFGIEPSHADTRYGYIRRGEDVAPSAPGPVFQVAGFTEKPDEALAAEYLGYGQYYWKSGIFMVSAAVWLAAVETLQPDVHRACVAAYRGAEQDGQFFRLAGEFETCPSVSVDVAVMERLAETGCTGAALNTGLW